jgi:uncharacterized protein (DUF342 family)
MLRLDNLQNLHSPPDQVEQLLKAYDGLKISQDDEVMELNNTISTLGFELGAVKAELAELKKERDLQSAKNSVPLRNPYKTEITQ